MYTLGIVMIIDKLFRSILYLIDDAVYNIIPTLYDLIISIARTSPLSQANIADMASRIYKLLAVFMVFKITFSLIMYVVNPDDFSDKSKGVSKLITNVVISLALLVLTPYIFNYAFQLQKIILEDNSLATVVFGDEIKNTDNGINTVGDKIAYIAMSPFVTPNLNQFDCSRLFTYNASTETVTLNESCFGFKHVSDYVADNSVCMSSSNENAKTLCQVAAENSDNKSTYLTIEDVQNYAAGVEYGSFNLVFKKSTVLSYIKTATESEDEESVVFAFSYKFLISTVAGIVVALFLITTCMDVGLRSIKLAFLQLIAPIPILSYIDPKSGKDGMFKKWYQMSIKTFLGLFVYLLAFYFAVYIISMVSNGNLYDVVDGSYVTSGLVKIFIVIGALMFVKALPKILEGLGIKLESGFTLNPIKKFEEQALGGKKITGAAAGLTVGSLGGLSLAGRNIAENWRRGKGLGKLTGALRGAASGFGEVGIEGLKGGIGGGIKGEGLTKGWKSQVAANRKMREAVANGSTFWGRRLENIADLTGMEIPRTAEAIESKIHNIDEEVKDLDNAMAPNKKKIEEKKQYTDTVSGMEKRAIEKIEAGEAGELSVIYRRKQAHIESLKARLDNESRADTSTMTAAQLAAHNNTISNLETEIAASENDSRIFLNDTAMKAYITSNDGKSVSIRDTYYNAATGRYEQVAPALARNIGSSDIHTDGADATLGNMSKTLKQIVSTYGATNGTMTADLDGGKLHSALGKVKGEIGDLTRENEDNEKRKRDLNEEKQELYEQERARKANRSAVGGGK